MTNKEILQASLLDILFEHRNKEYGAYALRKTYDRRLWISLSAALSLTLFFALLSGLKRSEASLAGTARERKETIVLKEVVLLPEKPKELEKPKPAAPKAPKVAARQYTSQIRIKPDKEVKAVVPAMQDLANKKIDTENRNGIADDGLAKPPQKNQDNTNSGTGSGPAAPAPDFNAIEKQPEFPGGEAALRRFLASQLQSPGELESGEKKVVKIRFRVEKDGSVNTFEIVTSAGEEFDREVVRVFRKMPRWNPALQNGMNVPVSFMMPVTFIGMD